MSACGSNPTHTGFQPPKTHPHTRTQTIHDSTKTIHANPTIVATVASPPTSSFAELPAAIDPLSSQRVVALVQAGTVSQVLATTNGGQSWTVRGTVPSASAQLDFPTPAVGYAWDATSLWSTTDGGQTWTKQNAIGLQDVGFSSPSNGMAIQNGAVMQTHDGGQEWSSSLKPAGTRFDDVSVVNRQVAYASAATPQGPVLYRTTNGGQTWVPILSGTHDSTFAPAYQAYVNTFKTPTLPSFTTEASTTFTSPNDGWLVAFDGAQLATAVFHTTNGGASWGYSWGNDGCAMGCNAAGLGLYPAAFYGSSLAWRYDQQHFDRSSDGGRHWTKSASLPINLGANQAIRQTVFVSSQTGWWAGPAGIFATHDGGLHWTRQWPLQPQRASSVAFTQHGYGWLVSQDSPSKLWITTDGGHEWQESPRSFGTISSLDLWGRGRGMVVDLSGLSWMTSNGGATWTPVPLPKKFMSGMTQAYNLQYVNPNDGYLNTADGHLWATHDGGRHWRMVKQLPFGPFVGDFISAKVGWALDGPVSGPKTNWRLMLRETRDGGQIWHPMGSVPDQGVAGVSFTNQQAGWIINGNHLLHTTDGGRSWTAVNLPGVSPAAVIESGRTVYITTVNARVLKSTDDGHHWAPIVP